MGVINMIRTMKEIHKEDIVLIKVGTFYNVYGKDAYIISYLFGYKLKEVEEIKMCGFPKASINKVIAKLEDKKINYLIVDRRNQYDVDEISDNKNLNEYKKYYENAKKYCNNVIRIENIHSFLLDNMDKVYF